MIAGRWLLLFALVFASAAIGAAGRDGITLTHFEPIERLAIRDRVQAEYQKPASSGPITLSFDALGRNFDLVLEPNANLMAAMATGNGAGVVPYKGSIAGVPGSWVRIVVAAGQPSGIIFDGSELIAVEPPGDNLAGAAQAISYRLSDVIIEPGALSCASGTSYAMSGAQAYDAIVYEIAEASASGAVSEIDVGAVGDFEFSSAKGTDAEAAIASRLNTVDGIYSEQIGVQINVPLIEIFTDSDDPFTEMDADLLLEELKDYRASSTAQSANGLTHMYTGRDLTGNTVGIAYSGVLCAPNGFASGLSEGNASPTFDSLVAAHEIGHNFGAPHDGEAGSPCEAVEGDWIMSPTITGSDQFSACSITEMEDDIEAASCITPLPSTDISVAIQEPDTTLLLTNPFQVNVDVVNNGTEDATNVVADVTLPAIVSLVGVTGATCTNDATSVNCQLGTVPGGTGTTIVIDTDTVGVGTGRFDATVSADADDRLSNNEDSVQLTVDPAVNLVINPPATPQVLLDQSTDVSVRIDNTSTLAATDVTLRISLNAALQANTASWSIGACTVAAQQVDCQASQFDAESSSTFSFNVTGLDEGMKGYTVTVASAEAEADPGDNAITGSVDVNRPRKDSGGSVGWLFLVFLAGIRALFPKRALTPAV